MNLWEGDRRYHIMAIDKLIKVFLFWLPPRLGSLQNMSYNTNYPTNVSTIPLQIDHNPTQYNPSQVYGRTYQHVIIDDKTKLTKLERE
jgi:hypothetical protein